MNAYYSLICKLLETKNGEITQNNNIFILYISNEICNKTTVCIPARRQEDPILSLQDFVVNKLSFLLILVLKKSKSARMIEKVK